MAYSHKTIGVGDLSVNIDYKGDISFSTGLISTMDEYFGKAFTLYHEVYSVLLGAPSNSATFDYNGSAPSFSWTIQEGSSKNLILQIDYLKNGSYMSISVSNRTYYSLSATEWDTIKNNSLFTDKVKEIRWRIKSNYINYPNQEPYYTQWSTFSIINAPLKTQETMSTILGSTRYIERVINLGSGGYKDFIVTFETGGDKLIQTFGQKDMKIKLYLEEGGKLLKSNDDGGYSTNALIKYNFLANTQYKIRVMFYDSSEYGNTKLAIAPASGELNTGSSDLNTYEDIYAFEGCLGFLKGAKLQKNEVKVITFSPQSSGSYKFTINSDFDTYIYVIDPRSSNKIVFDVNYNDDSEEGRNPLLITNLDANIPYLIIYSAFNPSSLTETKDLKVNATKVNTNS